VHYEAKLKLLVIEGLNSFTHRV